jgi:hypothetical protein
MNSIRISFEGSFGHELAARLDALAVAVRGYALLARCFLRISCVQPTICVSISRLLRSSLATHLAVYSHE